MKFSVKGVKRWKYSIKITVGISYGAFDGSLLFGCHIFQREIVV